MEIRGPDFTALLQIARLAKSGDALAIQAMDDAMLVMQSPAVRLAGVLRGSIEPTEAEQRAVATIKRAAGVDQ